MNNVIKNCSLKDIESNIDDYINLFLENGLLIFPKINFSDREQADFMSLFEQKLGWGYVSESGLEDHSVTFELFKDQERRFMHHPMYDLFIGWHLEHLERARPQIAASWRMDKFTCSSESGATGFIDASALYHRLSDEWKKFLDNCYIKNSHGPNLERPCVISHFNTGKKILRLCPYINEEIPCRVGLGIPSNSDIELYKEITQWVFDEIVIKEQDVFWWNWSEGDFVLIDLSTIVHAVKGGFLLGQRSFTRHWAYQDKVDYDLYAKPISLI